MSEHSIVIKDIETTKQKRDGFTEPLPFKAKSAVGDTIEGECQDFHLMLVQLHHKP